jgi:adenylate cyclase
VGRGDAMTATGLACSSCGIELPQNAKFCLQCGASVSTAAKSAEYKQVTVLFADVVHSMDIAAAVGAERLREIMAELVNRATAVVQRYGGTVDKFTGDGIMAVFGAPIALEDHAIRACLAALGVQEEAQRLAVDVQDRDGVDLQLRVGLNSGQVIAGEIGSGAAGYTAIGEQVGMAQRMESVAPPGGVMLSESTARLVEHITILGAPELVHIKGADVPVSAQRLLTINDDAPRRRSETTLVGRTWEVSTITALLDEIVGGAGCVVTIAGPAGIGKSRLVRESAAAASSRGVAVFGTYCESHTSDIAFRVVARLLRAITGVNDLDAQTARAHVRAQVPDADPNDVLLLDDLLGIADPAVPLPDIAPDARRRRLTALINTASLARTTPTVYVIEDVHWVDQASEALIADFLTVIPHTPSLVLITYRPEYAGVLTHTADAQSIRLRPLSDSHAAALATELLGEDPSVAELAALVAERAAGNPFFVEEIVRDLAEQGVLDGQPGAYLQRRNIADVEVPATLQAAIAARIDRLDPAAKRTINAAAVVGARFGVELLASLAADPVVDELIQAQLIDQVRYTPYAEYAFRHPLIQKVAYESQLKSARADLHRRLAATIDQTDENAALIAEHLEAAGDLTDAFDWHMRAGTWSTNRDITAAHVSWGRARRIADALPTDQHDHLSMRITPRTLISATAWRFGGSGADPGFETLRDLCTAVGDQRSLALGMSGQIVTHFVNARRREASQLAAELIALLEQIGDPALTVAVSIGPFVAKLETAEMSDLLRFAHHVIEQTDGNLAHDDLIIGAPLGAAYAFRGIARWCLGIRGWKDDLRAADALTRGADPISRGGLPYYTYTFAVPNGVVLPDATALRDTAEALAVAESGDNLALNLARTARAVILIRQDGPERAEAFDLFATLRDEIVNERFSWPNMPIIDIHLADEKARLGDLGGAIDLARSVLDALYDAGGSIVCAHATTVLAQALLRRGTDNDVREAQTVIDRLAAFPRDPGMALIDVPVLRLRALLARAHGDEAGYREFRDRYRDMARSLGFEGHIAWAEAMT